jgi:hypothetical protein
MNWVKTGSLIREGTRRIKLCFETNTFLNLWLHSTAILRRIQYTVKLIWCLIDCSGSVDVFVYNWSVGFHIIA